MNTQNLKTTIPLKLRRKIITKCGFFLQIIGWQGGENKYVQAEQTIYIDLDNPFEDQIQHAIFHEIAHFLYRNIGMMWHGKNENWYEWEESMCNNFADGMMKVCKYD
jgi:hypothetical protein